MDTGSLFAVALNLPHPWCISQVEFKPTEDGSMELHIHIAFQRGGKFPCPQDHCGKSFPAYDTTPRTWRHLNFFQYKLVGHMFSREAVRYGSLSPPFLATASSRRHAVHMSARLNESYPISLRPLGLTSWTFIVKPISMPISLAYNAKNMA